MYLVQTLTSYKRKKDSLCYLLIVVHRFDAVDDRCET